MENRTLTEVGLSAVRIGKIEKWGRNEIQVSALNQIRTMSLELSKTEMLNDYDEMVAAGLERQKKMNNDANDMIRDTYMGKLGVQSN